MEISISFECVYCDEYEPAEPRKMGFCKVHAKKVAKTNSCRQNPQLIKLRDLFRENE